ncbi:MAG: transposase [Pseudomonadales bacterium]|nr:transposase [Halioglobus sp.]MCP5130853.1 transposase [Pseudomonadales bacterium]
MTIPRHSQISLDDTPYYHCIARCVRRAFLCGEDHYSGKDFNHRRSWLVEQLKRQVSIFGIDICAYAIMSNHYHVVLRVDRHRVRQWSDDEVLMRWTRLFRGPLLVQRRLAGEALSPPESATVNDIAAVWRTRLFDVSWFMRCLNESIARRANAEDGCTGRFWEGRFKSQALLDNAALLSCMAYVDLNPIRAGIASRLQDSLFTSVHERLETLASAQPGSITSDKERPGIDRPLASFSEGERSDASPQNIPFGLLDYIALVEATGRCVRSDKRGSIPASARPALNQLGLSDDQWFELALDIQGASLQAIGAVTNLRRYAVASGRHWLSGARRLGRIFETG